MTLQLIVAALLAVISYFVWCYIHEMAHILMAKKLVGMQRYDLKVYPHRTKSNMFVWASCQYWLNRKATDKEDGLISLAPRIPDALAVLMFPLAGLMSGWLFIFWAVFWGAGLVDLFNGSLGIRVQSDLRRASVSFKINGFLMRIVGMTFVAASVVTALAIYF